MEQEEDYDYDYVVAFVASAAYYVVSAASAASCPKTIVSNAVDVDVVAAALIERVESY